MDLSEDHKNQVGMQVTRRLGMAIKDGEIEHAESVDLADHILWNFEHMTTREQLVTFLSELSSRWPQFANIATIEKAASTQSEESKKIKQVEQLIKTGQLDQAVDTAQT